MNDDRHDEESTEAGSSTEPQATDVALDDLSREELEQEIEVARAEIERLQDQSLRRQAELINYRKRVQKERGELAAVAQAELLEELLPVIDDFERAVEAEAQDAHAYHEGMQLILRSVQTVLERLGVERIDPHGEPFDPRYHEAIARQPTDEVAEGHILDVYQTGYLIKERLIRPASVVVAQAVDGESLPAAPTEEAPGDAQDDG